MWWTVVQLVVLALLEGEGDGLHGLPPIEPRVQALLKMITKQGGPKSGERERGKKGKKSFLVWRVCVLRWFACCSVLAAAAVAVRAAGSLPTVGRLGGDGGEWEGDYLIHDAFSG